VGYLPVAMVGFLTRAFYCLILLLSVLFSGRAKDLQSARKLGWVLVVVGITNFTINFLGLLGLKYSTAASGAILLRTDILFSIVISSFLFKQRLLIFDWVSIIFMIIGILMVMNVDLMEFEFRQLGNVFFLLSAFLLAANAFIIKIKLRLLEDMVIAFYSNIISTLCFFLVFVLSGDSLRNVQLLFHKPHLLLVFFILGLTGTTGVLFYYYSLRRLSLWMVRTLLLLIPIVSIILSRIFLKEGLNAIQILGMVIVLGNAVWIVQRQKRKKLVLSNI